MIEERRVSFFDSLGEGVSGKAAGGGICAGCGFFIPLSYIRNVTEHWGIDRYFQKLVSGETVKHPKPAPDVFLKTAEILGLSPEECLVIEDSENGCKAAKAAGMACMAYYNPIPGNRI